MCDCPFKKNKGGLCYYCVCKVEDCFNKRIGKDERTAWSSCFCVEHHNDDELVSLGRVTYEFDSLLKKHSCLRKDFRDMKKQLNEIHELLQALVYAPGGPGYLEGKASWDEKMKK